MDSCNDSYGLVDKNIGYLNHVTWRLCLVQTRPLFGRGRYCFNILFTEITRYQNVSLQTEYSPFRLW